MSSISLWHALFTLCLAHSALSASSNRALPEDVQAGYFPTRSGNLIFKPTSADQTHDSLAIFVDNSGRYLDTTTVPDANEISSLNVADVVTRAMGMTPFNPSFSPDFVSNDMFDRAKANLLVSVESIGEGALTRYNLANLEALRAGQLSFKMQTNSYPRNSLSLSTSVATGKSAADHGIVAPFWTSHKTGETVFAFSSPDPESASYSANVADVLMQSFKGQPLTVSVSGNRQHALAFSPNPLLCNAADLPQWNSFALSFDNKGMSLQTVSRDSNNLEMSTADLSTALHGENSVLHALTGDVTAATGAQGSVVVTFSASWGTDKETVSYDLNVPEEFMFFAELQYGYELASKLQSGPFNAMVADDIPDSYSVIFASLTGLVEKYGRESVEFVGAVHVLDAALPNILSRFNALYDDDGMVSQVILLGSHPAVSQSTDNREVFAQISRLMPQQENVRESFPSLYVAQETSELCEIMALQLDESFQVYCPGNRHAFKTHSVQNAFAPESFVLLASQAGADDEITQNDIDVYQIVLWMSILAWLAVFAAVYVLGWMFFKKDTLLYGTFNPSWEDRKRR